MMGGALFSGADTLFDPLFGDANLVYQILAELLPTQRSRTWTQLEDTYIGPKMFSRPVKNFKKTCANKI